MGKVPALVGIAGHFKDEKMALDYGKTITVGRSRSADFSLRRCASWKNMTEEEREKDQKALTVSGKHFEVTMHNLASIEVRNLSANGIRVDGKPVEKIIIEDVAEKSHTIEFGIEEKISLQMIEQE
ncbi:MAG: FHA domain-containing protein [Planctomycetota bacterium]|nr:FHA domain-containing protein [Planctomycetota bacterium]